eukprot:1394468-Rhodomonas_salina.1
MALPGQERAGGRVEGGGGSTLPIALRACYAKSGTELRYATMRSPVLTYGMLLREVRSIVASLLRRAYALSGTDIGYLATGLLGDVRYRHRVWGYQALRDEQQ